MKIFKKNKNEEIIELEHEEIDDILTVEEQTKELVENAIELGIDTASLKNAQIYVEQFPKILSDILIEDFTDISYTHGKIIVRGTKRGIVEYLIDDINENIEISTVPELLATRSGTTFGTENPYLDTDVFCLINVGNEVITKKLRATIFHEKIVDGSTPEFKLRYNNPGKSISPSQLRDTMANYKVTSDQKLKKILDDSEKKELDKKMQKFNSLIDINNRPTIIIAGATGTGKTEIQKVLVDQISNFHSIVSIADTNDAALKTLYPEKDIFELFANEDNFTIDNAIRAGLRSNPNWLLIAEIRDKEIEGFIKACQTNHPGITTIHGSSCEKVIERMTQLYKSSTQDMSMTNEQVSSVVDYIIVLDKKFYKDKKGYTHEYRYMKEFKKNVNNKWVNAYD